MSANNPHDKMQALSTSADQQAEIHSLDEDEKFIVDDAWADGEFNESVPEEEIPIEDERVTTAKYNTESTASRNAYTVTGDKAQMHNYSYYFQIVTSARQFTSSNKEDDIINDDTFSSIADEIKQALAFERQSNTHPIQNVELSDNSLPSTHEDISHWFYDLTDHERSYAQAAALLHGASAYEVSKRADMLYLLDKTPLKSPTSSSEVPRQEPHLEEMHSVIPSPRSRSSKDLQTKTYTITQRIDGIERLFWRDTDQNGLSQFHIRFLDFLAGEYLSKGIYGQDFLSLVQQWAEEVHSRYSWYSARALGVFLWHQSIDELRRVCDLWAKKRSSISRQRIAMLLDGAYEIDILKYPEHQNNAKASSTLQLLANWVMDTQKMSSASDIYSRSVIANVYALIGKRKLEIAFHGLEQLQHVPENETTLNFDTLQASLVSAYVTLGWSGHLHSIIYSLSSTAEQAVLQPSPPSRSSKRNQYRLQCKFDLIVSLEAFFLIAANSSASATAINIAVYQEPLSISPSVMEDKEQDIVLAGMLSIDESGWREPVIKLLCAAIFDTNNRVAAFDLLSRWIDTLMNMQEASSHQNHSLINNFKLFLVSLGETIDYWCLDIKKRNRVPLSASLVYKSRLEQWSKKNSARGTLVQQVLHQMENR